MGFLRKRTDLQRLSAVVAIALLFPGCGALQTVEEEVVREVRAEDAVNTRFPEENGIITDTLTGLQWQVGPDRDSDWDTARLWAENLDDGDWRMPGRQELLALHTAGLSWHDMGPFDIDGQAVWSDSTSRYGANAWVFDFLAGAGSMENTGDSGGLRGFAVREPAR